MLLSFPERSLYRVLGQMELSGEVRRGYFVEGLSGMQFALPEAARQLQELGDSVKNTCAALLIHSLDPANLYGTGAPFDFPLIEAGNRTMPRRPGNWLVLRQGHPVLLIEQHGKRISHSSKLQGTDLAESVACLGTMLYDGSLAKRHKLIVETWNEAPVLDSPGRDLLQGAGFVRDYNGMTLYKHA